MARTVTTYCRICEAACGLQAELDDDDQLLRLRPDKNHPISRGFVCAKGLKFGETAVHPRRLLIPQQRHSDGSYQPTSWAAAYEKIGQQLRSRTVFIMLSLPACITSSGGFFCSRTGW